MFAYDTATGAPLYSVSYGGIGDDVCNGITVNQTTTTLIGSFQNTVDFGPDILTSQGDIDIFVLATLLP